MSFFHTEKGKVITGVLAAVIATTAVMVPVSIFTDRAVRGDDSSQTEGIHTYSYSATAGTTKNGFAMADIGNGDTAETVETLHTYNDNYYDVLTDEELADGIYTSNGLGFGNQSKIGGYWDGSDDDTLSALEVVDANGEALPVDHSMDTVLSLNLKVTAGIADVVRGHMFAKDEEGNVVATPLTEQEFIDADQVDGYEQITNGENAEQFAVAVGALNYATYSETFATQVAASLGTDNAAEGVAGNATAEEIATWWTTTFSEEIWNTNDFISNHTTTNEAFNLKVDGSSTADAAMDGITKGIEEDYEIIVAEGLNNSGSGNSWGYGTGKFPGMNWDDEANGTWSNGTASNDTFLGTSSSLQHNGEVHSVWGYDSTLNDFGTADDTSDDAALLTTTDSNGTAIADYENGFATQGAVLETTIGIDGAPTFVTSINTKVETKDGSKTATPTGITKRGIYDAYVYGASWDQLVQNGDVFF